MKDCIFYKDFTFENFEPGNNEIAYDTALKFAQNPQNEHFKPILFYGQTGSGKTHLINAIGNYIQSSYPEVKIFYTTTESLMNEFTDSLREQTFDNFRKKYRSLDILLLDDIQFLEKTKNLQEEILYIFDEIHRNVGQLVFTSDRPIQDFDFIDDCLMTRLLGCCCVEVK